MISDMNRMRRKCWAHLKDTTAKYEDNDMFHTQVLLHIMHAMGAFRVFVGEVIVTEQFIHDVTLEMSEKVDFALEAFVILFHCTLYARRVIAS